MTKPSKIDRRVKYQQDHIEAGLCKYCPNPATHGNMCKKHRQKMRKRARDKYRTKAGIPLDAKLRKTNVKKYKY